MPRVFTVSSRRRLRRMPGVFAVSSRRGLWRAPAGVVAVALVFVAGQGNLGSA